MQNKIVSELQSKLSELNRLEDGIDFCQMFHDNFGQKGLPTNLPFTISFNNGKIATSGVIATDEQKKLINLLLLSIRDQQLKSYNNKICKVKEEIHDLTEKLFSQEG